MTKMLKWKEKWNVHGLQKLNDTVYYFIRWLSSSAVIVGGGFIADEMNLRKKRCCESKFESFHRISPHVDSSTLVMYSNNKFRLHWSIYGY